MMKIRKGIGGVVIKIHIEEQEMILFSNRCPFFFIINDFVEVHFLFSVLIFWGIAEISFVIFN